MNVFANRYVFNLLKLLLVFGFLVIGTSKAYAFDDSSSDIVINEIGHRDTSDWVEIYNKGEFEVNLNGWKLVNNQGDLIRISSDLVLPKGAFYVWRFGNKINNTADIIQVYDNDDTLVSQVEFSNGGENINGVSYLTTPVNGNSIGRTVDGIHSSWSLFSIPTIGHNNDNSKRSITVQSGNTYTTLQAAINISSANGTVNQDFIFLPNGNYTQKITVIASRSNLHIRGESVDGVRISSAEIVGVSIEKNANNVIIENITFNHTNSYVSSVGLRAYSNTGFQLKNVKFNGSTSILASGIELDSVTNVVLDGVEINDFEKDGVKVVSQNKSNDPLTRNLTFTGTVITNIANSNNYAGINFSTRGIDTLGGDIDNVKFEGINKISNANLGILFDGIGGNVYGENDIVELANLILENVNVGIINKQFANIKGLDVDFGTTDMDLIEQMVVHNCLYSSFELGTCQGDDGLDVFGNDLAASFGSMNYFDSSPPLLYPEIGLDLSTIVTNFANGYNGSGIISGTYRTCGGIISDSQDLYRFIIMEPIDATGVQGVEYQIRGSHTFDSNLTIGNYSFEFTPSLDIPEGELFIRFRAIDDLSFATVENAVWSDTSDFDTNLGNGIDGTWCKFIIDTKAPLITSAPNTNIGKVNGTFEFTFESSDTLTGNSNVSYASANLGNVSPLSLDLTPTRSFTYSLDTQAMLDGVYSDVICASDVAGNLGGGVSTTIPTSSGNECFEISFEIDNSSPVASFQNLYVDEVLNNVSGLPELQATAQNSSKDLFNVVCLYPNSLTFPIDAENNQNPIVVDCTFEDELGNTGSSSYLVEVLNVLPSVQIDFSPNTGIVVGNTVNLTANISDNTKPGNQIVSYLWSNDCTGTNQTITYNAINTGNFSCVVTVTDVDGDESSAMVNFSVSPAPVVPDTEDEPETNPQQINQAASVVILANPSTNVNEGTQVTLQGSVLSGDLPISYTYSGSCSGSGSIASLGLVPATTVPTTPGSYYCRVDVTDSNGDTAASGATVVVNQTSSSNVGAAVIEETINPQQVLIEEPLSEDVIDPNIGGILGEAEDLDQKKLDGTCQRYAMSGMVYVDVNRDGSFNSGDNTVSGINISIISILSNGGEAGSTQVTTDQNGRWSFQACEGRHRVVLNVDDIDDKYELLTQANQNFDVKVIGSNNIDFILLELESESSNNMWIIVIILIVGGTVIYLIIKNRKQDKSYVEQTNWQQPQ